MPDDDEFDHVVENSKRLLKINDQYKNHTYVEKFTKERSVMSVYETYVLEGDAGAKLIYGIYFRTLYQTMQAIFAGKL